MKRKKIMAGLLAAIVGLSSNAAVFAAEEVTLSVFDAQAYGIEEYGQIVDEFEEAHPGLTVEEQHAANDSATLLASRVNADDIPDIFVVESGSYAALYYEYAYDWSEDTEILGLFREDALAMGMDEDGSIKGLPWSYANMGLLYNKDCFEKAGITELPTTIEELEATCEKLSAAGITPIALAAKDLWVLTQLATHFMIDKELDADGTTAALKSGELTFADLPHWENFIKFLDLAVKYGPDKPLEVDWETSEAMLASGEAAIIHMGDWCQAVLDGFNADANLAFLPVPVGDGEEDTTVLSCCNWVYLVNKDSENLELAKEYVQYILTSEKGLQWTCEVVGAAPAAICEMEVTGDLANDANAYITAGRTNGWIHPIAPFDYSDICAPAVQAYMLGDMSAEDMTQTFQDCFTSGE